MKLPNVGAAVVPRAKIVEYLLSPVHPTGRHKARLFGQFGFSLGAWQNLAAALQSQGVAVTLQLYPKLGHGDTVAALSSLARGRAPVLQDIAGFVGPGVAGQATAGGAPSATSTANPSP